MECIIYVTLDVGQQDSSRDAEDAARNQLRSMDIEDIIELLEFETK